MRVVVNLIKLAGFGGLLVLILALTCGVALTHYQGAVAGLELMAIESAPLGRDALVGWIFDAIAADASIANWTAASITGLITVLGWIVCHHVFALIRLLPDAPGYLRQGQAADLWRTVVLHATPIALGLALLIPLLLGDAFIFQYRSLAGMMGASDPVAAANSVPAIGALSGKSADLAAFVFLRGAGLAMYLAMGVAPAIGLELVGASFFQTLALIASEISGPNWAQQDEGASAQVLYGYDAAGLPVHDPRGAVAYDIDQQPVQPRAPAGLPDPEFSGVSNSPAADSGLQNVDAPSGDIELLPVVGGASGEAISFSDALARKDQFHVTRNPRAIYARAYWQSLQADAASDNA